MIAADVFCGYTWQAGHPGHHRCELRPNHRGGHVCACGVRSDRVPPPPIATSVAEAFEHARFVLDRLDDVTGVSGTGVVAEGVRFTDGTAALRWLGEHPSTAVWPSLEEIVAVHGHQGATVVRWLE